MLCGVYCAAVHHSMCKATLLVCFTSLEITIWPWAECFFKTCAKHDGPYYLIASCAKPPCASPMAPESNHPEPPLTMSTTETCAQRGMHTTCNCFPGPTPSNLSNTGSCGNSANLGHAPCNIAAIVARPTWPTYTCEAMSVATGRTDCNTLNVSSLHALVHDTAPAILHRQRHCKP